jgi:hypothetical protein
VKAGYKDPDVGDLVIHIDEFLTFLHGLMPEVRCYHAVPIYVVVSVEKQCQGSPLVTISGRGKVIKTAMRKIQQIANPSMCNCV